MYNDPMARLAMAIVKRAALDARLDHKCDGQCRPEHRIHHCRADAVGFLRSDWCEQICDAVGLQREAVLHRCRAER